MIYFDHNATSPLHPIAQAAWLEAVTNFPGNPSSPHRVGGRAEAALNQARQRLARFLGCSPLDIIWTSGASESSNMVFHHLAARSASEEIWISALEHPCVLEPARRYFGPRLRPMPVTRDGCLRVDWLQSELAKARPALVALMAANNETGVLQPWLDALALCREHEVPFFSDAVQWLGKRPVTGLGQCEFVSGSAHKFGGPKGVGFLKVPRGMVLEPLIYGGPQEDGRRAGTENLAGVLAMVALLEAREADLAAGAEQQRAVWQASFSHNLVDRLPGTTVVGINQPRLWNTVSVLMPQTDSRRRWVVMLDKLGFAVSTGSACSSGKEAPSHVLLAMGYSAAEAGRVLRFSSGWESSESDWDRLLAAIQEAAHELERLR